MFWSDLTLVQKLGFLLPIWFFYVAPLKYFNIRTLTFKISGEQVFVRTIQTPGDLAILLKFVYSQAAIDTVNVWRRTSCHAACDENNINSHEEV
jgi:hypothetical protein